MDPTAEDEAWFRRLTAHVPFPCDWKGQVFWDSEGAKHGHVIDYYLRDGKGRLEGRMRDLQHLIAEPDTPLRASDVVGRLEGLRTAINRVDPHYRYEFSTSATVPRPQLEPSVVMTSIVQLADGGYLSIHVHARYPQATEDAPIGGSMRIVVPRGNGQPGSDSLEAALQAFLDFGRGLDLPNGAIQDLSMQAPGGLSAEAPTAAGVLGPARITEFRPHDDRLQVIDGTGLVLAETTLHMTTATRGQRGVEVHGADAGGAFDIRFQILPPHDQEHGGGSFFISGRALVGLPVQHLLPGMRVMDALHSPNQLLWRPEFGPAIYARATLPPELLVPDGFLPVLEAMGVIQDHTSIPILMPDELTSEQIIDILTTAQLLCEGVVEGTWTQGAFVLTSQAPSNALDEISPDAVLLLGGECAVTIGQVTVPLGPCHRRVFHPRIAEIERLEDGSRRVVLAPADGERGRAEVRLGPPPGSTEPPP